MAESLLPLPGTPTTAPDIRVGDTIRVFGHTGAHYQTGPVQTDLVIRVLTTSVWPDRPDVMHVAGRLCRADGTERAGHPHTQVDLTGPPRDLFHLQGMWTLDHREEEST